MKRNVSLRDKWRTPSFREDWCLVRDFPAAHNWSHLFRHNMCIYGNLRHIFKSIGRRGTLNWIFPVGRSDIPHFTRQHGRNSVLYRRPRHFEGTWGHRACPIWRRLIMSYGVIWKGEFTKTNHEPQTPWKQTSSKKFRQWQRTYWQGFSKIWRAGFNPVWTQMVTTSGTCYDVVTFLTQWGKSASNFVAISSLVVELLKKCRVW